MPGSLAPPPPPSPFFIALLLLNCIFRSSCEGRRGPHRSRAKCAQAAVSHTYSYSTQSELRRHSTGRSESLSPSPPPGKHFRQRKARLLVIPIPSGHANTAVSFLLYSPCFPWIASFYDGRRRTTVTCDPYYRREILVRFFKAASSVSSPQPPPPPSPPRAFSLKSCCRSRPPHASCRKASVRRNSKHSPQTTKLHGRAKARVTRDCERLTPYLWHHQRGIASAERDSRNLGPARSGGAEVYESKRPPLYLALK